MTTETLATQNQIQSRIFTIRGLQVMLDRDLAQLYEVETRVLNQAVKRNQKRFPERFMFQLTEDEFKTLLSEHSNLKSQFVTSSWGGIRKMPFVFTEQGVTQLSAVLRSEVAISLNKKSAALDTPKAADFLFPQKNFPKPLANSKKSRTFALQKQLRRFGTAFMTDTMKNTDENQIIKEALLYILSKEGKVRYYALMKTLYLAERDHLAQWGGRITSDVYHPLPYGPVPTKIYDALKSEKNSFLSDVVNVSNDYVTALRKPDLNYLSRSEIYALDRAIQFVKTHNFEEIKNATHDQFYYKAKSEHRPMTIEEVALSGGATPEMIKYINSQIAVEKALE